MAPDRSSRLIIVTRGDHRLYERLKANGLTIKPWQSSTTGAKENDGNKIEGTLRTGAERIADVPDPKSKRR
jgi:hypothetical protein